MTLAHGTGTLRRIGRRATTFALLTLLAAGTLAACTDDDKKDDPDGSGGSGDSAEVALPVVASWVVDGGTEQPQDVRVAIHGVRRVAGASVLDWSVTPLAGAGQSDGDEVAQKIDVGITPGLDNADAARLVDLEARKVYRPLDNDDRVQGDREVAGSLGIPWYRVENDLTVGQTRVLQYVFPELPDGLQTIAVANQGAPMIEDVPIAEEGQVVSGGPEVDLAAAAETTQPLTGDAAFTYPVASSIRDPRQKMTLRVDQVIAGKASTSVRVTVTASEAGAGVDTLGGMPISDTTLVPYGTILYEKVASGPGLQIPDGVGGTKVLRSWFSTVSMKKNKPRSAPDDFTWRECLCSNLTRSGLRLNDAGASQSTWIQLPALPDGTETVDVVFPHDSLAPFPSVAVTQAEPAEEFSTEDAADVGTWTVGAATAADSEQASGWSAKDWPTPVPADSEIAAAPATVDDLEEVVTDEVSAEKEDTEKVEVTLDSTVSFQPDSAKLTDAALKTIRRIAADIDENARAGATVLVEGHVAGTDQGSKAVQMRLSQQRADAVEKALQSATKSDVKFKSVGRGAEEPVAPNSSEENRRKNRRVVVSYEQ